MVYTATSLALAAMEMFVHLDPSVAPEDLVAVEIFAPDALAVEMVEAGSLPAVEGDGGGDGGDRDGVGAVGADGDAAGAFGGGGGGVECAAEPGA